MAKPSDPYGTGPVCAIGDQVEELRDAALAAEVLASTLDKHDDAGAEAGLARLIATTVREAAEAIEHERHRLNGRQRTQATLDRLAGEAAHG